MIHTAHVTAPRRGTPRQTAGSAACTHCSFTWRRLPKTTSDHTDNTVREQRYMSVCRMSSAAAGADGGAWRDMRARSWACTASHATSRGPGSAQARASRGPCPTPARESRGPGPARVRRRVRALPQAPPPPPPRGTGAGAWAPVAS